MAQAPEHGDSEHNLLLKIAENFGVAANFGDSKNSILYKIANTTYQIAVNPPSPSYDPDALAYVQASGATDIENINAFVVGIKGLGLWDSMVCWPLRSSQNAGEGETAYSLGGLGTYNGTLVGGPLWQEDGMGFNSINSSRIETSILKTSAPMTLTMVANFIGKNGGGIDDYPTGFVFQTPGGVGLGGNFSGTAFGVHELYVFDGFTIPITIANYFFQSATITSTSVDNWINGATSNGSLSVPSWDNSNLAFGGSIGQYFNGKISFGIFTDDLWSSSTKSDVFNLYKSTLGQGLGLP